MLAGSGASIAANFSAQTHPESGIIPRSTVTITHLYFWTAALLGEQVDFLRDARSR